MNRNLRDNKIQLLLVEYFNPGKRSEEGAKQDLSKLQHISSAIYLSKDKNPLLCGQHIQEAKDIFKYYQDGALTKWLSIIYNNRQTPYNMLSYYNLYKSISTNSLKKMYQDLPKKVAYTLATRQGSLKSKEHILSQYTELKQGELMILIQEQFPSKQRQTKQRMCATDIDIRKLSNIIERLHNSRESLDEKQKHKLGLCLTLMDKII